MPINCEEKSSIKSQEEQPSTLQRLFSSYPLPEFICQFLHRLPFALSGAAVDLCPWGTWEVLGSILQQDNSPDVLLARLNEQCADAPRNLEEAMERSRAGYTILIRHAERHHSGIARFVSEFETTFQGRVDAHIYVTPPGHYGFSWHYDAEDVFIMQLSGQKEYGLRKNTVNPWPLEETLPGDMQYGRELMPLMRVNLHAGDMLYIPCGYWHRGTAPKSDETSFSLAIGVMSRTGIDLFDLWRKQLTDSILWRQRLPILSSHDRLPDFEESLNQMIDMLAADLAKRIHSDDFKSALLEAAMRKSNG